MLPLDGVTVLDLTRLLPGAYATSLLVGLGAEVVKVEDPRGGDGLRAFPPYLPSGEPAAFVALCRGKRSVALDLKHPEGRDVLLDLVRQAHALVDSFRPGVLDRLGLGADALLAANPALVHVSMTAYGEGGRAALPGHDLNAQGYAGLLGLTRASDGSVPMPAVPFADMATGLQTALAVVSGLRVAERGGPLRADVTMLDSALSLTTMVQGAVAATGAAPPVPDMLNGGLACYGVYRCADGLELALGALEPQFFGRAVALAGRDDLAVRQYDVAGQDALRGELVGLFASRPRADWLALLEGDQTCASPVRGLDEALADPDLRARGVVVDVALADGSTVRMGRPLPWLDDPGAAAAPAPALGADSDELLRRIGRDPAAVRASGALG